MNYIIVRLFQRAPTNGHHDPYAAAMSISDELIDKMRAANGTMDTVRSLVTDILQRRHNVPVVTTIYEAVQEMKAGTDQDPLDLG
ncbi:hypothetical protein LJR220_003315 [Bradyrhizobium sp. LjRoot220]|uniref:hypothetical protein n=1 Tax=Bradyrhizobium sp. LjRoot220 TaxID=3342284 RepID=UPI003ECFD5C6